MTGATVARRYARALADVAASPDALERVQRELTAFAGLLRDRPDLRRFLTSPGIPRPAATEAVGRIGETMELAPLTRRFLRVVLQAGRVGLLESILQAYAAVVDERLGRVRAEVTTAVPLPDDQLARLRGRLEAVTGKQVYLQVRQDPALLAGVVTRIGSQVFDGSLRAQLGRLRAQLLHG